MWAWERQKLQHMSESLGCPPLIAQQSCYNLLYREEETEMFPYCRDAGIGCLAVSYLFRERLLPLIDYSGPHSRVDTYLDLISGRRRGD